MISTPGDSWHRYLFKCVCIVELSVCSCAPLIEIYDQVHVPMMSQYKLQRIDLLYWKNGIVRFYFISFFSFAMSDILYFPHISKRGNRCLCEIHPREWVPPSTLLSSLPALSHPSPCLIRRTLILLANFHERWYRWQWRGRLRGLRSSWQCIARWGGRDHCSSTPGLASPKHNDVMEVSADDEMYRI